MDSQIDDTVPLVFGEVNASHYECGGPVQQAEYYGLAYCLKCAVMIPRKQIIPLLDKLLKSRYNETGLESD